MDQAASEQLRSLLSTERIAFLGSLDEGAPFVSLVLFAWDPEHFAFYIHISGLAKHTQNITSDARVSLMVLDSEFGDREPQTAARVTIQGEAEELTAPDDRYGAAKETYIKNNPGTERNFNLGDFKLFTIQPHSARFVAGFARIFDINPEDLR